MDSYLLSTYCVPDTVLNMKMLHWTKCLLLPKVHSKKEDNQMSKWIEFQMVKNAVKKTKQSKGEMDSDLGMRRYLRCVGQKWHLNTS